MRLRKKHSPATTLTFPRGVETAEETIARMHREQAAYVARIVSPR